MTEQPTFKKARTGAVSVHGRSVMDYLDDSELRQALQTVTPQGIAHNDWILPVPDPEAHEQTIDCEFARLRALQSYFLLDSEPDAAFDKLTQEARDVFGVPTSLISLVDLGRQYLFSNTGADVRETPRDVAFCSHTIMNKSEDGILVVPDTALDERFKANPLVTEDPKLRFYAGASLVSPEGHRLGTFCVEGPSPREFTEEDKQKLKEYATTAMNMMVDRRRALRDRLAGSNLAVTLGHHNHWLRHAAVTTNLGVALVSHGDSVTAMKLFQESVQTILHAPTQPEGEIPEDKLQLPHKPSDEQMARHNRMVELLRDLVPDSDSCTHKYSGSAISSQNKKGIIDLVKELFEDANVKTNSNADGREKGSLSSSASVMGNAGLHPSDGIPGLFNSVTKLKGVSAPRPLPPLVFVEAFLIDMTGTQEKAVLQQDHEFSIDERPFTVPLDECSKATLFNMGLIYYQWCRPDTALQFFHLAASVSHKFSPLKFDPVDLCSVNNMAQIHLLLRKPDEAMAMLKETLKRGTATLASLYKNIELQQASKSQQQQGNSRAPLAQTSGQINGNNEETTNTDSRQGDEDDSEAVALLMAAEENDEAARKTRRLRRKLARTMLDMGHVHFFNNELDKALALCREAITLVDDHMSGVTLAATWYNLSFVLHHKGQNSTALPCLDNFFRVATNNHLIEKDHVQFGDAHQLKGAMMFDLGQFQQCIQPLQEALRIRELQFGPNSGILVETLGLLGKAYLALGQVDQAIEALTRCLDLELKVSSPTASSTVSSNSATRNGNGKRDSPSPLSHCSMSLEAAQIMLDLGRAHQMKRDNKAARQQYSQVHEWAKAFFGADHAFPARIASLSEKLSDA